MEEVFLQTEKYKILYKGGKIKLSNGTQVNLPQKGNIHYEKTKNIIENFMDVLKIAPPPTPPKKGVKAALKSFFGFTQTKPQEPCTIQSCINNPITYTYSMAPVQRTNERTNGKTYTIPFESPINCGADKYPFYSYTITKRDEINQFNIVVSVKCGESDTHETIYTLIVEVETIPIIENSFVFYGLEGERTLLGAEKSELVEYIKKFDLINKILERNPTLKNQLTSNKCKYTFNTGEYSLFYFYDSTEKKFHVNLVIKDSTNDSIHLKYTFVFKKPVDIEYVHLYETEKDSTTLENMINYFNEEKVEMDHKDFDVNTVVKKGSRLESARVFLAFLYEYILDKDQKEDIYLHPFTISAPFTRQDNLIG